jgi:type IV secretory pathway VirB3-like protein
VALGAYFLASANIILFFILGTLWLDRKLHLSSDPMCIIEYFLWRKKAECAILMHYRRSCVWDEVLQNKRLNKYNHSGIDE